LWRADHLGCGTIGSRTSAGAKAATHCVKATKTLRKPEHYSPDGSPGPNSGPRRTARVSASTTNRFASDGRGTPRASEEGHAAEERDAWDAFLEWAEKLYAEDAFDATERD
jgi:hypothetical protein